MKKKEKKKKKHTHMHTPHAHHTHTRLHTQTHVQHVSTGAAAALSGLTRLTISATVMLLEATGNMQYVLPIMLSVMSARFVGDQFNDSIQDMQIQVNKLPFLEVSSSWKRSRGRVGMSFGLLVSTTQVLMIVCYWWWWPCLGGDQPFEFRS